MYVVPGVVLFGVKQTAGGDAGECMEALSVAECHAVLAHVLSGHAHPWIARGIHNCYVTRGRRKMSESVLEQMAPSKAPVGMVWIPAGTFLMGSEDFYPEEAPVHEVTVDGFWMDQHVVTNEQFARFVKATGYVTVAERELNPADFPGAPAENLVPGSLVFQKTTGPVNLRDYTNWWAWTPGASWR